MRRATAAFFGQLYSPCRGSRRMKAKRGKESWGGFSVAQCSGYWPWAARASQSQNGALLSCHQVGHCRENPSKAPSKTSLLSQSLPRPLVPHFSTQQLVGKWIFCAPGSPIVFVRRLPRSNVSAGSGGNGTRALWNYSNILASLLQLNQADEGSLNLRAHCRLLRPTQINTRQQAGGRMIDIVEQTT